ncbi:Dihydropteroate synthase [Stieleria magnilauensis]|uniref:Dihydropteroate synthase n=2 Tax=Stieleria magnilauensis TaxID=2527963 RepID=A0ABX5XS07_9BACT|nr:Dihydropteroate synthase [Planctomycetes bacterium TBK1r]
MPESQTRSTKVWDIGQRVLTFEHRPLVMGILNVTPDSFSDGGRHNDPRAAIELALQMQTDGADIIDIGGESTRPYSDPVAADEELDRVLPVIAGLAGQLSIPISIDTSKAAVAKSAIDAGAEIINDVTGLEGDAAMAALAADAQVGVCVMHMKGTPQTMQNDPTYGDVVEEIYQYLRQRMEYCLAAGLRRERICLDPGIGFGKTHDHNVHLLQRTARFCELDAPILIGHSRKGFIGKLLGDKTADRTAATLGVSLAVAAAGADIIRVHDVKPTVDALKLFRACGGID